ncbi:hypothetical protein [Phenylobacterium sp.]|uniref:hypothetical protein n=1 Tax=Phenylobacterium sp. TaxID=1871053 RepID=UPI0025E93C68|nr:hypothetical protein [Phenylobacterium sp.]MBX3483593.1 hypothetical protein [Phenylobacterium sp.]MCW5759224.1 hypothetical protein [Phenylobacterium sp.]
MTDAAPDQVIVQSREKMAWVLVAAFVFLALGEWMVFHPESPRYSREFIIVMGALTAAMGACGMVAAAMQLAHPPRLTLTSKGLTYTGPYWRRAWSWSDVGEFVIERSERQRVIRFPAPARRSAPFLTGGGRETLPGLWRLNIVQVRDMLNAARERWG